MAVLSGLVILVLGQSIQAGTIASTAHDLSAGIGAGQVCVPCHAPHGTDSTIGLLWNHETTAVSFTLYGPTAYGNSADVLGTKSKMCLSCHDGTVALDSYGGATGSTTISADKQIGGSGDLTEEHPVGIAYDDTADLNPTTTMFGSGTIATYLTGGTHVDCSTCHDVHNAAGFSPFLRETVANSAICFVCHAK